METIRFNYSIFSNEGVPLESTMRYLTQCVANVKTYLKYGLKKSGIKMAVYTDQHTKSILDRMFVQENVFDIEDIEWIIKPKNVGLRGMFWRLNGFFRNDVDISIVAEGDYPLIEYQPLLNFYLTTKNPFMFVLCRQFAITKNSIAGGMLFCRPKIVDSSIAKEFNALVDMHEHLSEVDYGVDEHFVYDFAMKRLHDESVFFIVKDTLRISNCIVDAKKEIEHVKKFFPNANFTTIRNLLRIANEHLILNFPKMENLKFLRKNAQSASYFLDEKNIVLGKPFRVARSEFCQERLPLLLDKLLS